MSAPVVLFQSDGTAEAIDEEVAAGRFFPVHRLRTKVPPGSLVIPRYSLLPRHRDLSDDLRNLGSELINAPEEHEWIARFDWAEDLKDFTPRTWSEQEFSRFPDARGPFVVKGRTNSAKQKWSTLMYAKDRRAVAEICADLASDSLIGSQGLVVREYVELESFERCPISGIPHANEWRFFFLGDVLLSHGYYWSSASDEVIERARMEPEGIEFAKRVARVAAERARFFVLDIAKTADGRWILIEVNDGCMSGLSEVSSTDLYGKLAWALALRAGAPDGG